MKDSGINTFKKMRGKKFGVWIFGNEFEQDAALVKNGMDPKKDVTTRQAGLHMVPFLKREVDASSAMTYNELAQVLEAKNPKTGKLYQLSDLNVFKIRGPRHGDAPGRHLRRAATGSRTRRTRRPR